MDVPFEIYPKACALHLRIGYHGEEYHELHVDLAARWGEKGT